MASTQKKGNGRKKAPAPPPPPAYNAAARLVGGIVCALLALCVLVSYFNVDALLLTWIARVLRGTLGWGYYLTAPALAAVAVIQLGHKGRPVILRTVCVAVLPLLIGVLCHLALCRTAYEFGGGLAGMYSALAAAESGAAVRILCKSKTGGSGNSVVAMSVHRSQAAAGGVSRTRRS